MIRLAGFVSGSVICGLLLVWMLEGPLPDGDTTTTTTPVALPEATAEASELRESAPRGFGQVFEPRPLPAPEAIAGRVEPPVARAAPTEPPAGASMSIRPPSVASELIAQAPASDPPSAPAAPSATLPAPALPPAPAPAPALPPAPAPAPPPASASVATSAVANGVSASVAERLPPAVPLAPAERPPGDFLAGQAWSPVWQPFRSEISAKGFARRLAALTGYEFRVDPAPPRRFQVAVAHTDESDRQLRLAAIADATGLTIDTAPSVPPAGFPAPMAPAFSAPVGPPVDLAAPEAATGLPAPVFGAPPAEAGDVQ